MTAGTYKTIQGEASAEYEEKKSRFIAHVAHVQTEDEAVAYLDSIRSANPMAKHNVYAYVLREGNRVRYSDDGEPAKTSGLPTLSVIDHEGLKDVICVTTRYFGGTLLGTGGLVRAYTKAAQDAFEKAQKVIYAECVDISVAIEYPLYDPMRHWLDGQGIQVIATDFARDITLTIRVSADKAEQTQQALTELTHGQLRIETGQIAYKPLVI